MSEDETTTTTTPEDESNDGTFTEVLLEEPPFPEEVSEPSPDLSALDVYDDHFLFPNNLKHHERVNSRRWLLLPERYIYKPLRAMEAAKQCDILTAKPYGKTLLGVALRLRAQREMLEKIARDEFKLEEQDLQEMVDGRMDEYLQTALEDVFGVGFEPYTWAFEWLQLCDVRRVPLPSRRTPGVAGYDSGGLIAAAKGDSAWDVYYVGRHVHLLILAGACAWGSLGSFFVDLRK